MATNAPKRSRRRQGLNNYEAKNKNIKKISNWTRWLLDHVEEAQDPKDPNSYGLWRVAAGS